MGWLILLRNGCRSGADFFEQFEDVVEFEADAEGFGIDSGDDADDAAIGADERAAAIAWDDGGCHVDRVLDLADCADRR